MHFEVSKETLSTWFDKGWLTNAALLGGTDTVYSSITKTLGIDKKHLVLLDGPSGPLNGTGNAQVNVIVGNKGDNTLNGMMGNDDLRGGKGNDVLVGGVGKDTMTGGLGNDRFDFNTVAEIGKGLTRDVIKDFQHLIDDIDLATIDANGTALGHTFTFLATKGAAFTGAAGQVRWFQQGTGATAVTIVEGTVNADKIADFQI